MITTIGIKDKPVTATVVSGACTKCNGSGEIPLASIPAGQIKGLKVSHSIQLTDDCDCTGGVVPVIVKRIKRADRVKKPIIIQA